MTKLIGCTMALAGLLVVLGTAGAGGGSAGGGPDKAKSKADFEAFFKKLDTNKDDKLSKDEFLRMADRAKDKDKAREKLAKVYDSIDPDSKGIAKERFRTYLETKKKD